MCRRIYLKTAYPWVSSINYSALKLLTFFQEPFTMEPDWAHSRDSIEFLNPNLWQIGHGVHELWSDIQTNRDYYFIYIQGYPQRMRRTQTIVRNLLVSVSYIIVISWNYNYIFLSLPTIIKYKPFKTHLQDSRFNFNWECHIWKFSSRLCSLILCG